MKGNSRPLGKNARGEADTPFLWEGRVGDTLVSRTRGQECPRHTLVRVEKVAGKKPLRRRGEQLLFELATDIGSQLNTSGCSQRNQAIESGPLAAIC